MAALMFQGSELITSMPQESKQAYVWGNQKQFFWKSPYTNHVNFRAKSLRRIIKRAYALVLHLGDENSFIIKKYKMTKNQALIPERERHWKKYSYIRNKAEKIYYECECGKNYFSFSALYLHFERKHHQKIKNLHDSSQFYTLKTDTETRFIFYLRKNSKKQELQANSKAYLDQKRSLGDLRIILARFQDEFQPNLFEIAEEKFVKKLVQQLLSFVQQEIRCKKLKIKEVLASLALHFNDFVLSKEWSGHDDPEFKKTCAVLLLLSCWLNHKSYSQLVVLLNCEEPSSQQTNN